MTPVDRTLLTRIEQLAIDPPGAQLRFVDRLARDNGWTRRHADAVLREYRRFLFLAATADAPVTPSDAVDQAWHLHLAYSRSYWDDLCGDILGRPLHHGPTVGGVAEDDRYAAQYAATLTRYAVVFDETPPVAIWPPVEARFAHRFVRMATTPPTSFTPLRIAIGAVLATAIGVLIGVLTGSPHSGMTVGIALAIGLIAAESTIAGQHSPKRHKRGDGSGCGGMSDGGDGGHDGGHGCGSGCGGCGGD